MSPRTALPSCAQDAPPRLLSPVGGKEVREFAFSQRDFNYFRQLLNTHTGIVLAEIKQDMVYNRLVRRLRELGLDSFEAYRHYLAQADTQHKPSSESASKPSPCSADNELIHFINALTTNLTAFFREPHHFHFLRQHILPTLLSSPSRRIRAWSAGCSIGEEAYSLAICLLEALSTSPQSPWDIKILATDIDTQVLTTGANGIYAQERIQNLSPSQLHRWFLKGTGKYRQHVRVCSQLRQLIAFKQLNLIATWPMQGPFDFIFCRNVLIYFDKPTQTQIVEKMADKLKPGGHLFIGHSESLFCLTNRFEPLGQTIYRKVN